MANGNRTEKIAADQKLIAGVQANLSQFTSLSVGSQIVAPADIVKLLQSRVVAGQAAETARAAYEAAVKGERDARAKTSTFVSALRRVVTGMFSQSPDTLATFGLKAPKVGKRTAQEKAEAASKSKATREARSGKSQQAKPENPPQATGTTGPSATPAAK